MDNKIKSLIISLLILITILFSCMNNPPNQKQNENIPLYTKENDKKGNPLPIPPLLENLSDNLKKALFEIKVQRGVSEFIKGTKVRTYGYNGSYLGPTIVVQKGQSVGIRVVNELREYTTVHWHGLLVPGDMDGGPHQVIPPDGAWTASFTINQPAATAWYHPHGIGNTAIQVYKGLAGLFIIEDENTKRLDIPQNYGVNDIPLIIQDKRFTAEGVPLYLTNMNDIMEGMKGNTIIVNGVISPYLEVTPQKYRFRLLNGSNARTYDFSLSNGDSFYQIATDAGLLEKPYNTRFIRLSPGERTEIIIDFSDMNKDQPLFLISSNFEIIQFFISGSGSEKRNLPETLTDIEWLNADDFNTIRSYALNGMGHHVSINRSIFNSQYINERMKSGTQEIWNISSSSGGMMGMMRSSENEQFIHNFHAHGIHFQILERNGKPVSPSEKGWKDTLWLVENEDVKLITRFFNKGLFMYHCHILEHEDNGMMGQFWVE